MSGVPLQSLVNGQQADHISIHDRGFQYGDGCFETIRVLANKPILWQQHLSRLKRACRLLYLEVDFDLLDKDLSQLLETNQSSDVILKIIITRGEGGRGYAPGSSSSCTRVLQLSNYQAPTIRKAAKIMLCRHGLSANTMLAGIKHLNRLDQVLASREIPDSFDEGLCLDQLGYIVEGCKSNLMLCIDDELITPDLSSCGVEGVMLEQLIESYAGRGYPVARKKINLKQLQMADELFLCNSVFGVWSVAEIYNADFELYWKSNRDEGQYTSAAIDWANEIFRVGN